MSSIESRPARDEAAAPVRCAHHLVVLPARALSEGAELLAFAQTLAIEPHEARRRFSSGRAVIVRRSGDRSGLEGARDALRALGHGAAVVSDEDVGDMGFPLACRGVRIGKDRIAFLDAEERPLAEMPRRSSALLIAACPSQPPERPLAFEIARPSGPSPAPAEQRLARLFALGLEGALLDLAWEGCDDRVRITAGRFRFESLGELAGPSLARNMGTLASTLAALAGECVTDFDYGSLALPRPVRFAARRDDRFADRPRDRDEESFEQYARLVHAAWRGGLFEGAKAIGSAPVPPAGGAPPRHADLELTTAGAAGVLAHAASTLAAQSRTLGPPRIVLPLAIAAIAAGARAVLAPSPAVCGLALLAAGGLALSHAISLFSRKRAIENIPTSRIRSAAIGLCELKGKARAITPMTTPFSLMPCVYYEFRLVAREDARAGLGYGFAGSARRGARRGGGLFADARSGGGGGAGTLLSIAMVEGGHRRSHVVCGSSGEVPFLLEDETGSVEVDPRGAIVHVSSTQTFHNPPFAASMAPDGAIVTVEETYIPEGQPIYVLGELRQIVPDPARERDAIAAKLRELKADREQLASCDTDGDGAVDVAEWDAARSEVERMWRAAAASPGGRSDRLVIGRPESPDLFFISETSESKIVARFGRRAALAAILGLALSAAALALLARALGPVIAR